MWRRAWLGLGLCLLASASQAPPSVVFVLLDDVGWADLSYTRLQHVDDGASADIPTPHIDALAQSGVRFSRYYVHPTCTPSRAALMTGMYGANTGLALATMPAAVVGLPPRQPTLSQVLALHGVRCHMVGKWHLGNAKWSQTPAGRGFETFTGALLSQFDHYTKQLCVAHPLPS